MKHKNQINKEDHSSYISLMLLTFIFITIAVTLAILIIYILLKLHVIDNIDETLTLRDLLLMIALVSAIIGFLITFFSSRVSLKPVNQLINQLERLARGDFRARVKFGKPVSITPAFQEIESCFNMAAEELECTEMMRKDFINNFSHEFKTPIVSIAGFAKLLRVGDLTDEEKADYLAIIEEESLRLSYMATNVLNLTKVENQTILSDVSRYNLSEQLRSAILILSDMWMQKNLNLNVEFDEYMINANKELMEQVWINLLNNAIKFSDTNGIITVKIEEQDGEIIVSISNQGKEIPSESMDKIFNKFYQADESHFTEGNGIGLAIVKKVVFLHSGTISVESENGLTIFTVVLPKTRK
ncbi:MAG: HAMP domain-containing histidine kinase [Ruminococcus sp.]|nr:HAMP domain-containing histidine kinase [Ruminococcus sp.]